jgi:hypothetical protein
MEEQRPGSLQNLNTSSPQVAPISRGMADSVAPLASLAKIEEVQDSKAVIEVTKASRHQYL